jgi:hypothetical protein
VRTLGPPRGQNRAAHKIGLSAATGDFADAANLAVELNTGDLPTLGPRRGQNGGAPSINLSLEASDFAHPANLVVELNTGDFEPTREGARRAGGDARRSHGAASAHEAFAVRACCLRSSSITLFSSSTISMARTAVIKSITCLASPGDRMPPAQAATTACAALTKSPALAISGRSKTTGRSRRAGKMSPTQKRSAAESPAKALAISVRISASAEPSSTASSARVALLREPFGRPLRLAPEGSAHDFSPQTGIAPAAGSRSSMIAGSSPFARTAGR